MASLQTFGVARIAALTDGIYAVAMTLLVIDLKLPPTAQSHDALLRGLIDLLPRFEAWLISFLVLALFWFGHHRGFDGLRRTDGKLIALNIAQLGCVSLMPFSSELVGRSGLPLAQLVYSLNMALLGLLALLIGRYIYRHPELAETPVPLAAFRGAQVRTVGLIAISIVAVPLSMLVQGAANWAFLLMALILPLSHRIERRADAGRPSA